MQSEERHPLKAWREKNGLSQQELGDEVGVSKQAISSIERGRSNPSSVVEDAIEKFTKGEVTKLQLRYPFGMPYPGLKGAQGVPMVGDDINYVPHDHVLLSVPLPRALNDQVQCALGWEGQGYAQFIVEALRVHLGRLYSSPRAIVNPDTGEIAHKPANQLYPPLPPAKTNKNDL